MRAELGLQFAGRVAKIPRVPLTLPDRLSEG